MADPGIKKIIIPKASLPAVFGTGQKYVVRYRIISEDRNRTSHWSPQYSLNVAAQDPINYSVVVEQEAGIIRLVWEHVDNISDYDVYVKWDSDNWEYVTTISTTTYASLIRSGATSFKFAVQIPTFPKQRFTGSTLFETPLGSL